MNLTTKKSVYGYQVLRKCSSLPTRDNHIGNIKWDNLCEEYHLSLLPTALLDMDDLVDLLYLMRPFSKGTKLEDDK